MSTCQSSDCQKDIYHIMNNIYLSTINNNNNMMVRKYNTIQYHSSIQLLIRDYIFIYSR